MLYVFHGSDTSTALKKALVLVDSLRVKRPDAAYVRIDADHWSPSVIEEHAGGQGLFSKAYIVFLDRVSEHEGAEEILAEYAVTMNESTNIFILLEGDISTDLKKALEKGAEKVIEIVAPGQVGTKKKEEFNIFTLADAIGQRDGIKAWMTYRRAIVLGLEPESIVGTIFWQLKSMLVAMNGKNAAEAGLNPFVYSKAKKAADRYTGAEIRSFMKYLVTAYHDGHRGEVDMGSAIEVMILRLSKERPW